MKRGRGFTLIELVVALGIFALVAVMAYGGLNNVLDSRRAIERTMETTASMQKAYLRLRNDFQSVVDRPVRDGTAQPLSALFSSQDGRVEFSRIGWSNALLQPRPMIERVSYRLDDDERLVRESWRVLDRAPDSAPVQTILLEEVEQMEWRFLDRQQEWQERWPPEALTSSATPAPSPPPRAVEVTLQTKAWGELRFVFKANSNPLVGSSRVDLQACKLEYSIVSPK